MKERLRKNFYTCLSAVNKLTTKKQKILFYGNDVLSDNGEALFQHMMLNTDYKLVCFTNKQCQVQPTRANVFFINSEIRLIYEMLTSLVVVDYQLHRIKMKPAKKQFFLQVWHGSPLKSICTPQKGVVVNNGDYYSKILYSAAIFKEHLMQSFGVEENKMLLAGNPRNDYLFQNNLNHAKYTQGRKKVIWMPTFRHGIGRSETEKDIPILNESNLGILNTFLEEKEIVLYIKPHPIQKQIKELIIENSYSNICLLTDDELRNEGIPLYSFIGSMDALITDYSSVYFDYLLLDKPIAFTVEDIEEYSKNRGFAFQNPLEYMPGEKIKTFEKLLEFFDDLVNEKDEYKEVRAKVKKATNYYDDNLNCKRIVELIERFIKEV